MLLEINGISIYNPRQEETDQPHDNSVIVVATPNFFCCRFEIWREKVTILHV